MQPVATSQPETMNAIQKVFAVLLAVLLGAAGYGWWRTNQVGNSVPRSGTTTQTADALIGVNTTTFALAQRMATLAASPEETSLADSALRLADHELDVAFNAALRRIDAHPPVLSAAAQEIEQRLQKSQKLLDADQTTEAALITSISKAGDAQKDSIQNQLDLVATQVELDKDEVEEANQDLLEAGGNLHQRIQTLMQEHTAHEKPTSAPAVIAPTGPQGLVRRISEWRQLRKKQEWLTFSGAQASNNATGLIAARRKLATQLESDKSGVPELAHHAKSAVTRAAETHATDATALLTTTRQISADQKLLTLLDQRISDLKQLAGVYATWNTAVGTQTTAVMHSMLLSAVIVLAIVLLFILVDRAMEQLLGRSKLDRRQVATLRSVTRVVLQVLGVLIVLFIVIGVPSQLGTMIGLAGAGLTVALKDFIVAFIGWLVLMGRNGVRLGDWVEINGVSGEVVELGMFHTVLLETGNWSDSGRPTGRRVTFTNSFAIEGHYFNFSTTGQWLWDELLVLVPFDKDPNLIAEAIHKEVVAATADSAIQAEEEWRRTAPTRRGSVFSATPGISVKPAVGGVEVAIRYITRASERFQLRSKLFQSAVRLLGHGSAQ